MSTPTGLQSGPPIRALDSPPTGLDACAPDAPQTLARQQAALVAALQAGSPWPEAAALPLSSLPGPAGRADAAAGWRAYRANALAIAARALDAAHPTLLVMLGSEAMQALARDLWAAQLPQRGDLAHWGEGLPGLVQAEPALAHLPFLADVARLDWAVHQASLAADLPLEPSGLPGLDRLADTDPDGLWPVFAPGFSLLQSRHPVVSLWLAHREGAAPQDLAAAFQACEAGLAQAALVRREGWQLRVEELPPADADFTRRLLQGDSLGAALAALDGPDFSFEPWLLRALRDGWLQAWRSTAPASTPPET